MDENTSTVLMALRKWIISLMCILLLAKIFFLKSVSAFLRVLKCRHLSELANCISHSRPFKFVLKVDYVSQGMGDGLWSHPLWRHQFKSSPNFWQWKIKTHYNWPLFGFCGNELVMPVQYQHHLRGIKQGLSSDGGMGEDVSVHKHMYTHTCTLWMSIHA